LVEDEDAEFPLREGQVLVLPGLAEAFIGVTKGEEKTLELPVPEDFRIERFAGKTAAFNLTIKEVKEEELPEEDDEFAAQVNAEEFETFDALKAGIRENLEKSLQDEADARFRSAAID